MASEDETAPAPPMKLQKLQLWIDREPRKAESQMAAIVAKLEAIAKIEEKLATETDPAKVAALESKLVKLA